MHALTRKYGLSSNAHLAFSVHQSHGCLPYFHTYLYIHKSYMAVPSCTCLLLHVPQSVSRVHTWT